MICSDYLALQKTQMGSEDALHYLNPFGELLFTQKWKWSPMHQPAPKVKLGQTASIPSLKKDILIWYSPFTVSLGIARS